MELLHANRANNCFIGAVFSRKEFSIQLYISLGSNAVVQSLVNNSFCFISVTIIYLPTKIEERWSNVNLFREADGVISILIQF